jgi:hypothetical protein
MNFDLRRLTDIEINGLISRGCYADNWENIRIGSNTDLSQIRRVEFRGDIEIADITDSDSYIINAIIEDCEIGANPKIRNIHGILKGYKIGNNVKIENCGRLEKEPEASCGLGTPVNVLDETGSRPVYLYPGLTAQLATLAALKSHWCEETLLPLLQEKWDSFPLGVDIEDNAEITDTKLIYNLYVGRNVKVNGALKLVNGSIINNAPIGKEIAYVGYGVNAENFIVEDGVVDNSALLRNCYVGQGTTIDKGFTAHDSLFFANCACENGESCAVIASPYTVTMHKSSLLIGMKASFMNAGSGTNFSNHMYKLGPVNWGMLDRGVKMASSAYVMWGGRIGAFSLVMGSHKTHPDTSMFPFSYLFADDTYRTVVAPGQMLKSCGLLRDSQKWVLRDKRVKHKMPLRDNIIFDVFNPMTVSAMMKGCQILTELSNESPDADGYIHYGKLLLRQTAIRSGLKLYRAAILRYFHNKLTAQDLETETLNDAEEWADLGAQIMPKSEIANILKADSLEDIERLFDESYADYARLEKEWILSALTPQWRTLLPEAQEHISWLDSLIEADRATYLQSLENENQLHKL